MTCIGSRVMVASPGSAYDGRLGTVHGYRPRMHLDTIVVLDDGGPMSFADHELVTLGSA